MPDARTYPYEDNPGGTHWPDCYRAPGHHNCAVKRADELEAELVKVARTKSPIRLGPTSAALAGALSARDAEVEQLDERVSELEMALGAADLDIRGYFDRAEREAEARHAADVRFRKMERAVRHLLFRNHDHDPQCEGCFEFASFLALPGYQGAPHPLVDGH